MQKIMSNAAITAETPNVFSFPIRSRTARTTSIQMVAKPNVTDGDVSASGIVEGTNDHVNWFPVAKLNATGTGVAIDGGPFETIWDSMRFRLTKSDGCTVDVFLSQREG